MSVKVRGFDTTFWGEPVLTEDIGGNEEFVTNGVLVDSFDHGTTSKSKADLKWSIDISSRSWGLKDLSVTVPDQVIKFFIEKDDENGDAQESEIEVELKNVKVEMNIDGQSDLSSISIAPKRVEIFKGKSVVEFSI